MIDRSENNSLIQRIKSSGSFDQAWYLERYPDVAQSGLGAVEHYLRIGSWLGREPNATFDSSLYLRENPEISGKDIVPFIHSIIKDDPSYALNAASEETVTENGPVDPVAYNVMQIDQAYYHLHNPDIGISGVSVQKHFDNYGYMEMRNPRADFDMWWYTQNYLLGTPDSDANALAHYNQVGAGLGHLPHPPLPVAFDASHSRPLPNAPRRICLFAAYDADGIVDDYVLAYLRDMSKFADIYYLADGPMQDTELAKLDGLVKGAWGQRHGKYDFGSWSILARDLVGWDVIETYDETIFANDSCYLVHSLEDTFNTMAERPCAWWGLQATKGLISTNHQNKIAEDQPLTIEDIKSTHLDLFETDPTYDFHVGSYFLAFRKDVINDAGFRRVMDNVGEETNKLRIIRKYEIGITRFLIGNGYEFDTLVSTVTKQHPIFTERAFDLIDEGFPLLKRYFLTENHYKIEGLAQWKMRVKRANPDVDVAMFEKNLYRVGNATKLYNNFHIAQNPILSRPPRSHAVMRSEDLATPKYDHWWAFPVCSYSHLFSDNTRAVFERVKNDPTIKKIILTRNNHIDVDGVNVVVAPLHSYEGQSYLLRSRQVFLRHGVDANVGYPLSSEEHNFYNLWHGIPLKRIGYTSLDRAHDLEGLAAESKRLKSVISSSDVDRLAMAAAYWPLTYHDIWVTGLPRHDFILANEADLPSDFHKRYDHLANQLNGRKFVLFAPTFRANQEDGYYQFTDDEVQQLADWLTRNNMVMGIREHMADTTRLYSSQLQGSCFIDVSERHFPDIELLYRHADMLLTDYSSCFIDFMLTGRPMASFAFDQDSYVHTQRGLFYDQEMVFPGPVCTNFNDLMIGLEKLLITPTSEEQAAYESKVDFFHKFRDDHNSDRVIEKVKETYKGSKTLWAEQTLHTPDEPRSITFVYSGNNNITNRYRIFNVIEHLRDMEWSCRIVTEEALSPAMLKDASALFICRIPMTETLRDLCETYHTLGGKIIFDIDDLIHDMDAFSQSEYFRMRPEFASDFKVLSRRTQQMIDMADLVTVTTPSLAKSLNDPAKQVEVIPNSISTTLMKKYGGVPHAADASGKVRICYLSGTATHSEDFEQCRAGLARVLERHPQAELHIVGRMDINETKAGHSELNIDFVRHDLMPYDAMHDFLAGMDINLAPLAPSYFNDCKSELKIFEAALHSVPTIASATNSYAAAIKDSHNGLLAQTTAEWEAALEKLISDPKLRSKIGRAAFSEITPKFAAKKSARQLASTVGEMLYRSYRHRQ
ncbi:MAG: CDP-glycerol glycerophosphotransferase family protein [Litoreibacter sp.]|uniref:CDP-glycerol glycerophosphotransferase family protein n=1 Tax=Litoreibacter sp. TaxID=1969459 RepID=UPI0032998BCD